MSYWDRVLGDPEPPQQQQPAPVPAGPQRAWWRPSERPQPEPVPQHVAYDDPSYYSNPHGYAVNPTNVGKDAQLIGRILEEGYIRKPPKWVQQQPTDRCPECDSPNYAQLSGYGKDGVYGGTIRTKNGPLVFMRCWNCFSGDQQYVTRDGLRTFKDTVGSHQEVLAANGDWTKACIQEFGTQSLVEITFRPGKVSRTKLRTTVLATKDHRWITTNRGQVTDLHPGDLVSFVGYRGDSFVLEAFITGFGFGDGTVSKTGRASVELCGDKDKQWLPLFEEYGHNSKCLHHGDNVLVTFNGGHFKNWKQLPIASEHDVAWLRSWLEGYLAADGHYKTSEPSVRFLDSQNHAAIDFAKEIAPLAGYMAVGDHISSVMDTNFGRRKHAIRRLKLRTEGEFRVLSVRETGLVEPVFCATVSDGHEFVLSDGIRTGNCGYSTTGARTEAIEGARSAGGGPVMGAARQTATGGANLQNFGEISMSEWHTA